MIAIYGEYFPPAKPKELLREEKEWLTDIGRNSWLCMKCAQHAADNSKCENMGFMATRWWP